MRTDDRWWMRALVAALLLALLPLGPARPAAAQGTTYNVTLKVRGAGGVPTLGAIVWVAPIVGGVFDWPSAQLYTVPSLGGVVLSGLAPGNYGLQLEPPRNEERLFILTGVRFTVTADPATHDLGTLVLPAAQKQVTGRVLLAGATGSTPLQGVTVYGYNVASGLFATGISRADGTFGFGAAAGSWEIFVDEGGSRPWQIVSGEQTLLFADDGSVEQRTITIRAEQTTGQIRGRVRTPDDLPPPSLFSSTAEPPAVVVTGLSSGRSRSVGLDSTGAFTIPVAADTYELSLALDEARLAAPPDRLVKVVSGTVNLGTITLLERNATVNGVVACGSGPLAGVLVQALGDDGQPASTRTAPDGSYSLAVVPGSIDLSVSLDPTLGYLDVDTVVRVTAVAGGTTTHTFTPQRAAAEIAGSFVEAGTGSALTDVRGWAYARDEASDEFVAWAEVVEGAFRLNVPAGRLRVGVQLAPGTPYSLQSEADLDAARAGLGAIDALRPIAVEALEAAPFEQVIAVRAAATQPAATRPVRLTLQRNNATISGALRDSSGALVTDVAATVILTPASAGGAVQLGEVDPATGRFAVGVVAGVWNLSFLVDDEETDYRSPLEEQQVVDVEPGATATRDIVVQRVDGVVAGQLRAGGAPLPGMVILVSGETFAGFDLTDEQGNFSILVPSRERDGRPARYSLGTDLSCNDLASCYFDIAPRPAVVAPLGDTASARPTQVDRLNNIDADPVGSNAALFSAQILDSLGRGVSGARINVGVEGIVGQGSLDAKSFKNNGGTASVIVKYKQRPTNLDGQFLIANKNFAVFVRIANERARVAQSEVVPQVTLVVEPTGGLRGLEPAQFDARAGWSATLPDGTRVEIPAGAVVLNSGEVAGDGRAPVQVTVTPTSDIYPTQQFALGSWYGVEITLRAAQTGRLITRLEAPMRVTLRYSGADIVLTDIREGRLRAARLLDGAWQATDAIVADRGANKLTFQTREPGRWALVQQVGSCLRCYYLPMVGR